MLFLSLFVLPQRLFRRYLKYLFLFPFLLAHGAVQADADGNLIASGIVSEPVALATTATTTGTAVDIFDFTLTDGGTSDTATLDISQVVLNTSGTGTFSKVTFRLNGTNVSNVVGVVSGSTITFSGLAISIADGESDTYTVNAYYSDDTGLSEGETYILSIDGDTDLTITGTTTMASTSPVTNSTGTTVDITATQLVFTAQPSSVIASNNMGAVTLQAQDAAGNIDPDFTETVTLTDENQAAETDAVGALSTTSNGNSLAVAAVSGQVSWANLTYDLVADINIDANSTSFNVESANISISSDSDGNLIASATVTEPVALPSSVITTGAAVDIFDFTLTDGATSDGLSMDISQVLINTSGSGDFAKVTFRLSGTNVSNVVGVVSGSTLTFSGLAITVADGGSETYTVNAYYSDNTSLTEDQTYILSLDGDTYVTSSGGTTMGSTSVINNGTGTTVDVTATQLVFSDQPNSAITNANMGPVTLQAHDAAGNIDVDFTETITLTDEDQTAETDAAGVLTTTSNSNSLAVAAVSGQASWANLTYDAIVNINIDANSTSFNVESNNISIGGDANGDLTASVALLEPISLNTTADSSASAIDIFDFTLSDAGGDGLAMDISQIVLNTSGIGDFTKVIFRLNGTNVNNVTGVLSGSTITFSALTISVAESSAETYTVNAYYLDNTGLTEGDYYILSIDGDSDVTVTSGGTVMGTTNLLNNGSGSPVEIVATQLVFTQQPISSVIQNQNFGPITIQAHDAVGNLDPEFIETISLTDEDQGAETGAAGILSTNSNGGSLSAVASGGEVSWANLTYDSIETINIDVSSASFNVESNVVTISSSNTAPVITEGGSIDIIMDEDNNPTAFSLVLNATDSQGDTLTWSLESQANNGAAVVSGSGSSTQPSYTPTKDYNGVDSFVVKVDDGSGLSDSITVNVTVSAQNDPPVVANQSVTTVEDSAVFVFLTATDVDDTSFTYSIVSQPANGSLSGSSPNLIYTPNTGYSGQDSFSFNANDGSIDSNLATVSITVTSVNTAPVVSEAFKTTEEDVPVDILLTGTDVDQDSLSYVVVTHPINGALSGEAPNLTYSPNIGFSGNDSFSFKANDGEADSNIALINISVNQRNINPIALDDEVEVISGESIDINVLSNDSDEDLDSLTVVSVNAEIGNAEIVSNSLVRYQSITGFVGDVLLQYGISDGNQGNATALILVHVLTGDDATLPLVTPPADIVVNSDGFLTQVDLGLATAVSSEGFSLPVSLLSEDNFFEPGRNLIYWQATDANGNTAVAEQVVEVHPLIYFSQDQFLTEGQPVGVDILLNGESPSYPIEVNYTLTGTANSDDHDLADRTVVITEGTSGHIEFNLIEDGINELDETIKINLVSELNSIAPQHIVTITGNNVAPTVSLNVQQDGKKRIVINKNGGEVIISTSLNDLNAGDEHSFDWSASSIELSNLSTNDRSFIFLPSDLVAETYQIGLTVTDDGSPVMQDHAFIRVEVVNSLPALTDEDSDNDGIPDISEGFGDEDKDGVPDYLDNISACNILVEHVDDTTGFLIEGEVGGCLSIGATAMGGSSGGAAILEDASSSADIPDDSNTTNIGGIFDFVITQLNNGQTYSVVLPQLNPIPIDPIYRKYNELGWTSFFEDQSNKIFSAPGNKGHCPPPESSEYLPGLITGHWCVRLLLKDGGLNDSDGLANGVIFDPGGVAVIASSNNFPQAVDDIITAGNGETLNIDVIENDVDIDNDSLTLVTATAFLGEVEIMDNLLEYTAPPEYLGDDSLEYTITDGNGGSSYAAVIVEIRNRAPIAVDDVASAKTGEELIIDVLANDSDPDLESLTITSAVAVSGNVSINEDQTLTYSPVGQSSGSDTIDYTVTDGAGGEGSAKVTVTITQNTRNTRGGSGRLSQIEFLFLLLLVSCFSRRTKFIV